MTNPNEPATGYEDKLLAIDSSGFGDALRYVRGLGTLQDFRVLRSHFSAPRMFDVYLKDFGHQCWTVAGVSLLAQHTLLADFQEPTVAISIDRWNNTLKGRCHVLDHPKHGDQFVRVQIWSVDPTQCGRNRMIVGTLLSFTERELQDPRLGLAVDEMARTLGFSNQD